MPNLIPRERIENRIFLVRGQRVMIDRDLAELHGVETGALNRQVRRNIDRFPFDFMFQLTRAEFSNLKCQFGISSWGGTRKPPFVFTKHGILMLSSVVVNSRRAIHTNIAIMRTFSHLRELLITHRDLREKIEQMERKYDQQFRVVFDAIKKLLRSPQAKTRRIGF